MKPDHNGVFFEVSLAAINVVIPVFKTLGKTVKSELPLVATDEERDYFVDMTSFYEAISISQKENNIVCSIHQEQPDYFLEGAQFDLAVAVYTIAVHLLIHGQFYDEAIEIRTWAGQKAAKYMMEDLKRRKYSIDAGKESSMQPCTESIKDENIKNSIYMLDRIFQSHTAHIIAEMINNGAYEKAWTCIRLHLNHLYGDVEETAIVDDLQFPIEDVDPFDLPSFQNIVPGYRQYQDLTGIYAHLALTFHASHPQFLDLLIDETSDNKLWQEPAMKPILESYQNRKIKKKISAFTGALNNGAYESAWSYLEEIQVEYHRYRRVGDLYVQFAEIALEFNDTHPHFVDKLIQRSADNVIWTESTLKNVIENYK